MSEDLAVIRARAKAHALQLDAAERWLSPQKLAARWDLSVSTVKAIPRGELPYMEHGRGLKLKRRRYHPADVLAYEERQRQGERAAGLGRRGAA